jgi:hypothetical protein
MAAALTEPSPAKQFSTLNTASCAPMIAAPETSGRQCGNCGLVGYVVRPARTHPDDVCRHTAIAASVFDVHVAASRPCDVTTGRVAKGMPDNRFSVAASGRWARRGARLAIGGIGIAGPCAA